MRDPDAQVGRLHRLAMAGGPCWGLARLLRRGEALLLGWCGARASDGGKASAGQAVTGCWGPGLLLLLLCANVYGQRQDMKVNLASGSLGTECRWWEGASRAVSRWKPFCRKLEAGQGWAKGLGPKWTGYASEQLDVGRRGRGCGTQMMKSVRRWASVAGFCCV